MTTLVPAPPPTVSTRQPFVQFARGMAILTIVTYHFLQKVPLPGLVFKAVLLGGSGIYVFFFASGYGLALSRLTDWPTFFRKRFRTVLLPYYVAVTLIFVVNAYVPLYKTDGWREYLSHLLLYKMFVNRYDRNLGEHLWFVSTIVQFYLAMPLLNSWLNRSRGRLVLAWSVVISLSYSALITIADLAYVRVWYSFFLQYLWVFMLGMVVARSRALPQLLYRPRYVYGLVLLGCLLTAVALDQFVGRAGNVFNDLFLFGVYASGLVLLYLAVSERSVVSRVVLWFESFSYSLYLVHMLVFGLYRYATHMRPFTVADVVFCFGLVVVAGLVFEKPPYPPKGVFGTGVSISPLGGRGAFITFLRGFSMVAIVAHHCLKKVALTPWLYTATFFGGSGIHAFIFASGYGLALSRLTGWPAFFRKRFQKVLLPYYVAVTLIFALNVWLPVYPHGWREWLSHLLLYKMFDADLNMSFGGHFWFISTIAQFYVLFPALVWFVSRATSRQAVGVALLVSLAWGGLVLALGKEQERIWTSAAPQYVWEFVLGMVLARTSALPALLRASWVRYVLTFALGVVATFSLARYGGLPGRLFNDYAAFVAFLSAAVLAFRLGRVWTSLARVVAWVEPFSYALFLTHIAVLDGYNAFVGRPNLTGVDLFLLVPVLVLVAKAFDALVDWLLPLPNHRVLPGHIGSDAVTPLPQGSK